MNIMENLRIAVSSLLLNRTRAALTMLGIIIGVGAVITLVGFGRGVETSVTSQFEGLGADTLTVRSNPPRNGFSTASTPLTMANAEAIAAMPGVQSVSPEYQVQATVVNGRNSVSSNVRGVSAAFFAVNDWYPASGSMFSEADIESQAQIALLGTDSVEDIFGDANINPIGQTIRINDRAFTVAGVLEEKSSAGAFSQNAAILVPISTAQSRLGNARVAGEGYSVSSLSVQLADTDQIDAVTQRIEAYLLAEHDIANAYEADFEVQSPSTIVEARSSVTGTLTLFLSGIAAISLLVGGIGVMNIMLVSVSERTREIGLRKAVGARSGDILSQFLIESTLLALLGGFGGVLLGWIAMQIAMSVLSTITMTLSPDVIVLALGVSSSIGIFFGLFPASRAARMRPVQALRFE
jgi:putative ABC transport system permease protein